MKQLALIATSSIAAFAACADKGGQDSGEASFEIVVAPLTLPGITETCYGLTVYNSAAANIATADTVWTRSGICADDYGDGIGSISFVGTCDADPDGRVNTVALEVENLYDDEPPTTPLGVGDYFNPCTDTAPCLVEKPCNENEDTLVEFNITIMRTARQGFFDIAVNFEQIFCSAKFDCSYDGTTWIDLLFNGTTRGDTAVLGFACTRGTAAAPYLYLDDVTVTCDGSPIVLDTDTDQPGNQPYTADSTIFGYAVYQGTEAFTGFSKSFWNVAIGFADGSGCTVQTSGTAAGAQLTSNTTPAGEVYPYLDWTISIPANGSPCADAFPGSETGLDVVYSNGAPGESFDNCGHDYGGGFATFSGDCQAPTP